jgi:hypothetical protein
MKIKQKMGMGEGERNGKWKTEKIRRVDHEEKDVIEE